MDWISIIQMAFGGGVVAGDCESMPIDMLPQD